MPRWSVRGSLGEGMSDILKDAAIVYGSLLRADFKAQEYLKGRGVKGHTAMHFLLGATGNPGDLYRVMSKELGYPDEVLESSGLMRFNGEPQEVFYNSVIIPIKDARGRVVNLSSRKYDGNKMKYVNMPNMPLLDFFGVEVVADRYRYTDYKEFGKYIVLAEGQFDTIILQQFGYPTMGIMGVHNIRAGMFKHFEWFDSVIICFDNDAPGLKATEDMASYIKKYYPGMKIYKAGLGDYNDANDFFLAGNGCKEFNKSVAAMINIKPKPLKAKKAQQQTTRSSSDIQELKDIKLEDFLKSIIPGIQWNRRDTLLKTECPFKDHKDSVASFTIYRENNTYYCWGCGRGGDIINFCNHFFGVKFRESVDILKKWRNK